MNFREITKDIYYAGVNDRVTDRFEGLWPLPCGVSYNSYVVSKRKTALVDSVEAGYVAELISNVEEILGVKSPDFLIVNHMEPDHSGGIPMLCARWPEMKIVGNRQTINIIKGFYHINDDSRYHEVKDHDVLDLGGEVLEFTLTPMVHWPETMMCFATQSKVLFSGDAFGCFGAMNGGIVDSEMDCGIYIEEMYRYYSNIVGKYGVFVQKALAKLAGLTPAFICSTHGPVWHDDIERVMDIYDRLSRYEGEPGATIIYGSMYGHTAEVAEAIARRLAQRGIRRIRVHNASKSSMSEMIGDAFRYGILIVGSPTYSMRLFPPVEQFLQAMETREVKNKVFACFGSHTWSPVAATKIGEYLQRMKWDCAASFEMKQAHDVATGAALDKFADDVMAAYKK